MSPMRHPFSGRKPLDAGRVLALLAGKEARLAPAADEENYRLVLPGRSPRHVPHEIVDQLLRADAIERCEVGFRISAAGRARLRRKAAASEPFAEQHQARVMRMIGPEADRRLALVNDAESPLAWLRSRKDKTGRPLIADYQYEAGERLRADYERGGLMPRVTASWDRSASSRRENRGAPQDPAEFRDFVLAARERVNRAIAAVGPELSGILIDVCCHLKGLEEAEQDEGWPKRCGKVILQIALTRLARHYGLISDRQLSAPIRQRMQHWGAADYRPSFDGV